MSLRTRAEDLLLHDGHFGLDVGEDGGLNEEPFTSMSFATKMNVGTFLLADINVVHDTLSVPTNLYR